jgi:hypothetical protein
LRPTRKRDLDFFELRPLHLVRVVRDRATVIPLLRLIDVTFLGTTSVLIALENGEQLAFDTVQEQAKAFFGRVYGQLHRLRQLATSDMLETELELDPLRWTP